MQKREGKKGGRVRGEEGRVLFVLLHRLRAVERTCLLRACVNQQLAGPRKERGRERGGEGEAVLAGRQSQTANGPGWRPLSFQDGFNMMGRRDGEEREKKKNKNTSSSQSDDKTS